MPCTRPSIRAIYSPSSSCHAQCRLLAVYVMLVTVLSSAFAHPQHVDHSDTDIHSMTIDDLLHVEHDLRHQNSHIDKHIASLHGRLSKLRYRQTDLEKKNKKVGTARDFEVRQRQARDRDLDRAQAQLQAKKSQVTTLEEQTEKLRGRIRELSNTVLSLNRDKHHLEDEYAHPSLQTAFLNDATRIGPVTQHVANKTVEVILPELRVGLEEAGHARRFLQNGPTITSLFASFVLYVFAISLIWCLYRLSRNVSQRLTMARMLFSVDLAFAAMWALVCVCFTALVGDPLQQFSDSHSSLSLLLQLLLMACLVCNVILRCFHVSASLSLTAGIELLCVIFVAQHFYQGVWRPLLFDEAVRVGFGTYMGYMIVNGGLAVSRARAMDQPVEKLRLEFEEVDGIVRTGEWLRDKLGHVWRLCEDWLTSGAVDYDDVESVGKSPWKLLKRNDMIKEGGTKVFRH